MSRWNSEKLTFANNQEKEDRILAELVSIKNHVVQGFEEVQATGIAAPGQGAETQAPESETIPQMPEWRRHLLDKGLVYPLMGKEY